MNQSDRFANYPSLKDRPVLITGGGSGIGAVIVEEFARQGARVGFVDLAAEASRELVNRLRGNVAHEPYFVECDLRDIPALQRSIQEIEKSIGTILALVNNAGNDDRHGWEDVTPEYWDNCLEVNLRHQFFAMQAVAPGMKAAQCGSIVNMSSISWMIPAVRMAVYVAAKAAVVGMTRTMARELGTENIRVNSVSPGAVITERQQRLWRTPEYDRAILNAQCLKRAVMPQDVARLMLFLAADDSSAITQQNYVVDAGWV
ncbi:MAG TPA: SDR family oxidoreductase [Verrucomicrobiae bacterium]|nr:SDR family oxidoreductase [Verrucomicrobiae bacterium]